MADPGAHPARAPSISPNDFTDPARPRLLFHRLFTKYCESITIDLIIGYLSPMLFNIYISDLPETTSRKYGYADDLAILLRRPSWKEMEEGLNKDMTILVDYLRKWRLQLSVGKTVSAAYHLNNREAKRELDVFVDNKRLHGVSASSKVPWRAPRPDAELQATS